MIADLPETCNTFQVPCVVVNIKSKMTFSRVGVRNTLIRENDLQTFRKADVCWALQQSVDTSTVFQSMPGKFKITTQKTEKNDELGLQGVTLPIDLYIWSAKPDEAFGGRQQTPPRINHESNLTSYPWYFDVIISLNGNSNHVFFLLQHQGYQHHATVLYLSRMSQNHCWALIRFQ